MVWPRESWQADTTPSRNSSSPVLTASRHPPRRFAVPLTRNAPAWLSAREPRCFACKPGGSELQITGYGSAIDTHHLTQPHPSGRGPAQAMQGALTDSGLSAAEIDYINAHGTGTPLNDSSEGQAILSLCPSAPTSSTKSMTGHALGAAGAIEAAFSVAALQEQFLPPNINFRQGDPETPLEIVAASRPARLRHVLSNSFGFGGSNASITLSLS